MAAVKLAYLVNGKVQNQLPIQQWENDRLKIIMTKEGPWYYVNAWGRESPRSEWRQFWHSRTSMSYMKAFLMYSDVGAAKADYQSQLVLA
jgi:hypothetical protein